MPYIQSQEKIVFFSEYYLNLKSPRLGSYKKRINVQNFFPSTSLYVQIIVFVNFLQQKIGESRKTTDYMIETFYLFFL